MLKRNKAMTFIDKILGKNTEEGEKLQNESNAEEIGELSEEIISKRIPRERVEGRIIKLGEGWGFISSKSIPYTRIFFHWSALNQNTLRFPEIRRGMFVEFEPIEIEGKGVRAIRIKVLEDEPC